MADHVDDLIDYEEDDVSLLKKPADSVAAPPKKGESTKKPATSSTSSYTGIHSTGFKEFLLKPELMRTINDCGFEHPSEGISNNHFVLFLCPLVLVKENPICCPFDID